MVSQHGLRNRAEKRENCNIASRSRIGNTPLLLYNLKEIKACSRIMGGELMDGVEVKGRMTQRGLVISD